MRGFLVGSGLAVALAVASPAAAQLPVRLLLGGGITQPIGSANDLLNTGWHGQASLEVAPPLSPVAFRAEAMYHRLAGNSDLLPGRRAQALTGALVYRIAVPPLVPIKPYFLVGGGVYDQRATGDRAPTLNPSVRDVGVNAGLGTRVGLGPLKFFVEARYHRVFNEGSDLQLVPLTVGVSLGG